MSLSLPKVLFATFHIVPGTTRQSAITEVLLLALTEYFQVDALSIKTPELGHMESSERLRMLRIPLPKGDYLSQVESFCRAIIRQLEGEDYQVIHVRSLLLGAAIAKRKLELGAKLLVEVGHFDSIELPVLHSELGRQPYVMRRIFAEENFCIKEADIMVTSSRVTEKFLQERGRLQDLYLVPEGVNIDRFDWQFTQALSPPVILYVGSLHPWQGLVTLIEAINIILQHHTVRLVLLHSEEEETWKLPLQNLVNQLGITEQVEFRGPCNHTQIPQSINQADICVAPYAVVGRNRVQGNFPVKILEYLACRRPVVASRLPMVEEVVRDEREALLFTPGDAKNLSKQIIRLLENTSLASQLAETGYRRVRESFSAARLRRQYSQIYRTIWEEMQESFPRFGLEVPIAKEEQTLSKEKHTTKEIVLPSHRKTPQEIINPFGRVSSEEVSSFIDLPLEEDEHTKILQLEEGTEEEGLINPEIRNTLHVPVKPVAKPASPPVTNSVFSSTRPAKNPERNPSVKTEKNKTS